MSELRIETFTLPAATVGPENPLPPFAAPVTKATPPQFSDDIPEEDRRHFVTEGHPGALPHRLQDNYTRRRRPRGFRVAVLENDALRATFMLELGGRLWSLYHKPARRELLYVNPVFQPACVALRDAWVSGGVEWNVGILGHTPYTCSPVFAARVQGHGGTPVLRLYEWDRIRGIPYQMDFSLPDGSPWLLARMRLVNPHEAEIPMYWWSNTAVPERPDVRVIAPADSALEHAPERKIFRSAVPVSNGVDRSYATNITNSVSIFYYIPSGQRPWITALDKEGRGLIQTSTARLRGRKLFAWGMGPGGRRWNEFLSVANWPYVEIQAGLTRTQEEYAPMPAHAEWTWVEAYGLMEADPAAVHGRDWTAAQKAVESRLNDGLPLERFESELVRGDEIAHRVPTEILQRGSGWGALERLRRNKTGEKPFCGPETPFDDATMGPDQAAPWRALLEDGAFPTRKPSDAPGAWMVQPEWQRLLDESVKPGRSDHWLSWLHLGVMHYYQRESERAAQSWRKSLSLAPSAWAWRNLAVMAKHEERPSDAADLWRKAHAMMPEMAPLLVECLQGLVDAKRPAEVLEIVAGLPARAREHGRVKVLTAQAALETGDLNTVERILRSDIEIANMREGETVLTNLWFGMQEKRLAAAEGVPDDDALKARVRRDFPPPPNLDFRMQTTG